MNEHEKALPAGGPAKLTQNAVKIYVISSRERLLLPLAFCFCLLLVNTLLWSGPTAGLTASVCVWYGLLGLYLGRTLLNTWESRVLLAVNLALAATLALVEPLGAACWGIFLLHEPVGGQELAGMGLLFGGVALLALGKKTEGTEPTEEREHSRPLTGKGAPQH